MAKLNLKVVTAHGTFTRSTATAYTHAVVRSSPRAAAAYAAFLVSGTHSRLALAQRFAKDLGHAVTWHGSEQAARNAAAKPYFWDAKDAIVLGVFPVEAA